jgi:hypothetical protein
MRIFEKWWHKGNKVICLYHYKEWLKPEFKIYTNGAKRKNGDSCYDFNIHLGRFAFWYTNYDLQRKIDK